MKPGSIRRLYRLTVAILVAVCQILLQAVRPLPPFMLPHKSLCSRPSACIVCSDPRDGAQPPVAEA